MFWNTGLDGRPAVGRDGAVSADREPEWGRRGGRR